MRTRSFLRFALAAGALALPSAAPRAQGPGVPEREPRPFVRALEAQAMGDAVAAVPHPETAFFYNPAHLARLPRLRLTYVGFGVGTSAGAAARYAFWRDELQPALEEGLEHLRTTDHARLEALYGEALDLGRRQSIAAATLYGPAVQAPVRASGLGGAVGAGLFGTGRARLRFADAGAGVPFLDAYGQADVILPVTAAVVIPETPLAVGVTASYTRRSVTAKAAFLDTLSPDDERLYVFTASGVRVDAGLHTADVLPGLDLGAAFYGLLGSGFTYRHGGDVVLTGSGGADDLAEVAALEARFNGRTDNPSFRVGAAYRVAPRYLSGLPLGGVTVSADYVSASTSDFDQTVGARLRAGVDVAVLPTLRVRTGVSQGYPSVGATLSLPRTQLDYAFFGVEDGREPGQLGRYNHHLRLRFGLF
jgi:hypothetical protein